jgi:hypothetical protein
MWISITEFVSKTVALGIVLFGSLVETKVQAKRDLTSREVWGNEEKNQLNECRENERITDLAN